MIRKLFSIICFLFVAGSIYAQDNLTGRIAEDKTRIAIAGVKVQNIKSGNVAVSDPTGAFSIPARVGDIIVFSSGFYLADTLYVQNLRYIVIAMQSKANALKEVKVTQSEVKTGNLKAPPILAPLGGNTLVYHQDDAGNYNGGLTMRLFDSHSGENKRKKEAQFNKDEAVKNKIAEIFSPQNLKNYVPIKDQEMANFITLYTPDIATYTAEGFNLTLYIDSCYKEFVKIPPERRQDPHYLDLKSN